MIEGVIYRYKSPSGKYYIGQTTDEKNRRSKFFNQYRYGGPKIERARKKYGPENFEYTILMKVTGDNPEEVKNYLNTLEIGFIRIYDSYNNGYNSTIGGGGIPGHKHSEETKHKMSFKKYLYNPAKGKPSPKKGIPMSEESKKKMSEARLGKAPWNKGKNLSEEIRQKMSESRKGRKAWNKGIPMSDEQKKKISDANKGKPAPIKGRHRVYNPDGSFIMIKDPDPITPLW